MTSKNGGRKKNSSWSMKTCNLIRMVKYRKVPPIKSDNDISMCVSFIIGVSKVNEKRIKD